MATIEREIPIDVPVQAAWAALRDVGAVDRLVPGLVAASRLDGEARTVTFASGAVLRELIVTIDDERRRFAYASVGGQARHHNASFQAFAAGPRRCRLVWITDVLPDALAAPIAAVKDQALPIIRRTLEAACG